MHITPTPDTSAREAARILARLIDAMHVTRETPAGTIIEATVPLALLDRLAIWGSAAEDLEIDDPAEDDGNMEEEVAVT